MPLTAAVRFADESMEEISYYTISASVDLAAERGRYAELRGLALVARRAADRFHRRPGPRTRRA